MQPATLEQLVQRAAVAIAAVFLEHAGELDDAAVTRYLEPSLGAPALGAAAWSLGRLGISAATAARLSDRTAFYDALDDARTTFLLDGAYVVVKADVGLVRLAVRDYGDHYGVEPGAELGPVLGARIRLLARNRRVVGAMAP